ncbi:phospholipase DDHD2-like [Bacillus rossius redtenbacheri]|uniref:phospholipase DDHD2-like n=1 Tax=Bacillus rossius redtenbacheri TaxID=93214 RepID=UPI002FDCE914
MFAAPAAREPVATDGGRYDVELAPRLRAAAYWDEAPQEVRRCSWFSQAAPFEEAAAAELERGYVAAVRTGAWGARVALPGGGQVLLAAPGDMLHFPDSQLTPRPCAVQRGVHGFPMEEGEADRIDHLLFVVHGIGSGRDQAFRRSARNVDDFRSLSQRLVRAHFASSLERGRLGRVETLPVYWHGVLRGETIGLDGKLRKITLRSVPKLRHFTNHTLTDILFYTSPVYCQVIMDTVGNEINRVYGKFRERNPNFEGEVSLAGHSLGSVILFDLLCNQKAPDSDSEENLTIPAEPRRLSQRLRSLIGKAGAGQLRITYPQIVFQPKIFFAFGSPIALFVTVRGNENLGEEFALPTCPAFFNIFHPFDPVACRVEALVNPELASLEPVLVPHHQGRMRLHLELKEAVRSAGLGLKSRLVDSAQSAWNALFNDGRNGALQDREEDEEEDEPDERQAAAPPCSAGRGRLNGGRRVDHVLQEAPLELFNQYVFAVASHLVYWRSEDTALMVLKEMYALSGVSCDSDGAREAAPDSAGRS